LAMALNYLREGTGASKWITAGNLRIAAAQVHEGATVEEAAARVGISVSELENYLDGASRLSNNRAPISAKPEPWDVTPLVEAARTGHFIQIDPDTYRLRQRTALQAYAANCRDPEMQAAALKLIDELDRRFGLK